jgi:hypothetical protein
MRLIISQRGGDSSTFPHGTDKAFRRKSGDAPLRLDDITGNDVAHSASYLVQDASLLEGVSAS